MKDTHGVFTPRCENPLNRADIMVFTPTTTDDILKIHIAETLNLIVTTLDLPGTRYEAIFDIIWQSQYLKEVLVTMIKDRGLCSKGPIIEARAKAVTAISYSLLRSRGEHRSGDTFDGGTARGNYG